MDQRLNDMLGEHTIPAVVVDWEAVTSLSEDSELDMEMNNLELKRGLNTMDVQRAQDIFESKDTIAVHLDGEPVWIEEVDVANRMATVQVGSRPTNTHTVGVERLEEQNH